MIRQLVKLQTILIKRLEPIQKESLKHIFYEDCLGKHNNVDIAIETILQPAFLDLR